MADRTLFLLSPYRPPTSYPVTLTDDEASAWMNGYAAIWHPAVLRNAIAPPVAASAYDHDQPAGRGSDNLPGADRLFLPLRTGRGKVGVVGIRRSQPGPLLTPTERRLLDALLDQTALAVDRVRLARDVDQTRLLAETERLRTALLTSLGHDLKTPLASILGTITALRGYGSLYDEATRDEIGKVAAAVPNVRVVTNEIQVGGLSSAGSRANDTLLTAKVRGNFLNSSAFSPLHVKVLTEAGVVYLMGIVTEAEADAITELARTTSGVRKVVRVFDYCKTTDELCKPPPPSGDKPRPPRV